MNKSRFLRIAGFALCIEFIFVVGMFISTSNSTTSSVLDVLPTQMVLPVASIPVPQNQVTSSEGNPEAGAAPEASVKDSASPAVVSNRVQAASTNTSSQQPAVAPPAHVPTEPTQIPLLPQVPVPNQVVIQFRPEAKPEEINAYVASVGGTINHKIDALNTIVINLPAAQSFQVLPSATAIVNSEPDYFVSAQVDVPPSDPLYTQQWDLPVIGAPDAWKALLSDAPKVTIAIIDSGICADHSDLKGRILPGWDFVEDDAVPQDEYGHGCGVAGIIAANVDDGAGMAGIAPNAMILPLRVLDAQGVGTYSNVAAAIVRAADAGAQVINLSLGGNNPSSVLENAIDYAVGKHVMVVAAAGNTGGNILYPAAYAPVVAVGSVDANLQRSSFSSYLPQLDTLAPGSNILTTALKQSYATVSGTSFAAAEVSGIVALGLGAGYPVTFDGSVITFGQHDPVPTQPVPTTPLTPIHIDGGDVQPLAVIGPVDSRVQVTNTTVTPNSAVVLIVFNQGSSPYICSGSVIAPQYVLTAGHCVYEAGVYSTNFAIYPGNNGASAPFGVFGATLAYVPPTWISTATGSFGNADVNYDWALLRLNSNVSASVQPFALTNYSDSVLNSIATYINAGYPGDKCSYSGGVVDYCPPYNGRTGATGQGDTQWTASGSIVPAWLSTYLIGNQIDTYGGQSGSPLYITDNNQPVASRNIITGLLSHSLTPNGNSCYGTVGALCPPQNSGNYFRRVTLDMLEALVATGVPFVNPSCYQVNLAVNGSGTVTRSLPRSQGCATGAYTIGTSFNLSAVASPGYVFTGWSSGTSSNDVNTTYTVTGAATITATFVPQPPPAPNTVLAPGYYDDRNTNIGYSSGWILYNGAGPSANTLTYTKVQNATAKFAFNGIGLILYRALNTDRGMMEVCIDLTCQTINSYSSTLIWNVPVKFSNLSNTTHIVTLRNLSTDYVDLDAVQVLPVIVSLTSGLYQENDPNISYLGNWNSFSGVGPNGGGMTYTNDPNAQVSFSFTGKFIRIYRTFAFNRGPFQVCIDNSCQNVNNYDAVVKWNMPVTISASGSGIHQVTISNTSSSYIDFDAVQVLDALDPLTVGMHDDQDTNITYSAGWVVSAPAGGRTVHYTNVQDAGVSFQFTGDALILYRTLNLDRGTMEVCIDLACQTINNYSPTIVWNAPVSFYNLGNTTHKLTIRNLSSSYIDLDAVQVLPVIVSLTSGLYQENDPNISYLGNWLSSSNTILSGGSLVYSNDPNAQISFKINSDALTLYRTRNSDRGSIQVCVDLTCQMVNNTTPDLEWTVPYTLENLGAGVHTITIRNQSAKYIDLDAIRVGTTPAALTPGSYDDRDSRIIYNGLWYTYDATSPQNSTISYNNVSGDEILFSVVGDAFRIYRSMAINRGSMSVCIDIQACVTVNNYSVPVQWSMPVLFSNLGAGTHKVVIRNTGSGSTPFIDLDSIEVLLTSPTNLSIQAAPTSDVTLTETPTTTATVLPAGTVMSSATATSEVPTSTPFPTDAPTEIVIASTTATLEVPTSTPLPTETPTEIVVPSTTAMPEVPTSTLLPTDTPIPT